jgi:hypothetical protein
MFSTGRIPPLEFLLSLFLPAHRESVAAAVLAVLGLGLWCEPDGRG